MKRDRVIDIIRKNRAALEQAGVTHAYLFGSVARDEAGEDSDVDVMIDVAYEPFTLFGIMRVAIELEDRLSKKVDVVIRADALEKGRKLNNAAQEAVSVF